MDRKEAGQKLASSLSSYQLKNSLLQPFPIPSNLKGSMANRIPPPDSESHRLSQAKKLEEAQKIAAISKVDPDAQAKKRRFQQMMETPEDDETRIEDKQPPPQSQPSPYQPSFYDPKESSNLDLDGIPSPNNSQPPNLNGFSPQEEDLLSGQDLPQSPDYWNQVDLPNQPIEQQLQLIQEPAAEPREQPQQPERKMGAAAEKKPGQQESKKQAGKPEKKLEPSPFGPPGKPVPKKEAESNGPPPFVKKKAEEKEPASFEKKKPEEEVPAAKYWETQPEQVQGAPVSSKDKDKDKDRAASSRGSSPEKPPEKQQPHKDFAPILQKAEAGGHGGHDKEGGGRGRESKKVVEISQPSLPGFPPTVHTEAAAAATIAAPYLRPEVLPLFYQMVGAIFVMANQGISTTEILLNNPAFAGSKFFGASIEIIKYSSAPDSLNIRLSGSNEAVTAFSQNIPGLMAAFQTGGFRFRIGRIDAGYAADKPVFRRKEEKGDTSGEEKNGEGR